MGGGGETVWEEWKQGCTIEGPSTTLEERVMAEVR